jgi:hypothetical protein
MRIDLVAHGGYDAAFREALAQGRIERASAKSRIEKADTGSGQQAASILEYLGG